MLGIVLIFWATLCQSDLGVWGVQQKFFYSLFVVERLPDSGFPLPVLPGGYLIGGFLEVPSIDTHSDMRDKDLRSEKFFGAEKFPLITFKSKSWVKTGEGAFDVTGDLTIKDVTKSVVLKVKLLGFGPGMRGAMLSGWEASTTLNRNDFGITTFPKVLGDDVGVAISVEADLAKVSRAPRSRPGL